MLYLRGQTFPRVFRHPISLCYTPFLSHTGHPLRWWIIFLPWKRYSYLVLLLFPGRHNNTSYFTPDSKKLFCGCPDGWVQFKYEPRVFVMSCHVALVALMHFHCLAISRKWEMLELASNFFFFPFWKKCAYKTSYLARLRESALIACLHLSRKDFSLSLKHQPLIASSLERPLLFVSSFL